MCFVFYIDHLQHPHHQHPHPHHQHQYLFFFLMCTNPIGNFQNDGWKIDRQTLVYGPSAGYSSFANAGAVRTANPLK